MPMHKFLSSRICVKCRLLHAFAAPSISIVSPEIDTPKDMEENADDDEEETSPESAGDRRSSLD